MGKLVEDLPGYPDTSKGDGHMFVCVYVESTGVATCLQRHAIISFERLMHAILQEEFSGGDETKLAQLVKKLASRRKSVAEEEDSDGGKFHDTTR